MDDLKDHELTQILNVKNKAYSFDNEFSLFYHSYDR